MNAYWIITQHLIAWQEVIDPEIGGPWYHDFLFALVFAETRGQARAIFCDLMNLDFTEPVSIRKVASHVQRQRGVARDDDVLYIYVGGEFNLGDDADDYAVYADWVINDLRDYPAVMS